MLTSLPATGGTRRKSRILVGEGGDMNITVETPRLQNAAET